MQPYNKLRRLIFTHTPNRIKVKLVKVANCSICGKQKNLSDLEVHHKFITMREIMEEYKCGKLSLKEAKHFARDVENLCLVCSKCHKKLHKNENYGN